MRGEWKCRDWELGYWGLRLQSDISFMYKYRLDPDQYLNYTKYDITPGQIGQVLESLDWEFVNTDRDNDYRYEYYYNSKYEGYLLTVSANIDTFKIEMYFVEEN